MRTLIFYHDGCLDGFVAGMIAHTKAIYDGMSNIRMVPINYNEGNIPHVSAHDNVIMVDFCMEPHEIEKLRKSGANVTIVDHHETQIDKIYKASFGKFGMQATHNISYSCDCRDAGNNFFSKLVDPGYLAGGEYRAFLSDNREIPPIQRNCGTSMVYNLAIRTPGFQDFMKTFLSVQRPGTNPNYDLTRLVELVRTHDLWLHDGLPNHDASYLALWFKQFMRDNKELRDMYKEPRYNSFDIFAQLKARFLLVSLAEKLAIGKKISQPMEQHSRTLCAGAVELGVVATKCLAAMPGTRVGFIPGDFTKANISMTGSILVKESGFDVAIMVALSDDDTVTFSMRSDQFGKNVNIGKFADNLKKQGIALKGGGHRNAAGFTIAKSRVGEVFTGIIL